MVTKKRQINYEVLRLIACFAVVLCHVAAEYYYVLDHQTFSWKVLQWFLTITLFHVPTFFMLNGCFLFKREPTAEFIRKNVGRLFVMLLFWSIIYAALRLSATFFSVGAGDKFVNSFSLRSVIDAVVKGSYHLWFLYALIGIYLVQPFLYAIVKKSQKVIVYFLILAFVFGFFLPTIISWFGLTNLQSIQQRMSVNLVLGYVFYTVAGYYFKHYSHSILVRKNKMIFGVVLFVWIVNAFLRGILIQKVYIVDMIIPLFTCALFLFAQQNFNIKNEKVEIEIQKASNFTLGVFLVHPAILYMMTAVGITKWALNIEPILGVLLLSVVLQILSSLMTWAMQKMPVLWRFV